MSRKKLAKLRSDLKQGGKIMQEDFLRSVSASAPPGRSRARTRRGSILDAYRDGAAMLMAVSARAIALKGSFLFTAKRPSTGSLTLAAVSTQELN